jgi:hypothetical protein
MRRSGGGIHFRNKKNHKVVGGIPTFKKNRITKLIEQHPMTTKSI